MAKDAVCPSRVLRRQLVSAQQRLREMQDELESVREQEALERRRRRRKRYRVSLVHTYLYVKVTVCVFGSLEDIYIQRERVCTCVMYTIGHKICSMHTKSNTHYMLHFS